MRNTVCQFLCRAKYLTSPYVNNYNDSGVCLRTDNAKYLIIDQGLVPSLCPDLSFLFDERTFPNKLKAIHIIKKPVNKIILYEIRDDGNFRNKKRY